MPNNGVILSPDAVASAIAQDKHHVVKERAFLRGSGIFSSIGSYLIPMIQKVAKYIYKRGKTFVKETSDRFLNKGDSITESLRRGALRTLGEIGDDIRNYSSSAASSSSSGAGFKRPKRKRYGHILTADRTS